MTDINIRQILNKMTLEEKAGLCSGLDFWHLKGLERLGIPSILVTDGPHGLRKQKEGSDPLGIYDSVETTCFPSAAGVASSWNRSLVRRMGEALGEECQAENVAVLLGPGTNIKRSPLCGRNFEYFSEDPFLSSEMAANHIMGIQSQGVGASLKHFAANNQEHRRMSINAIIDERVFREIYLASFENAVKQAQPWTVMCSYNRVNGEYTAENKTLLTDILRDEWGFEGFVVSDWGAVNERVEGLAAGLDLEMPSTFGMGDKKIIDAVNKGILPEETLNKAVERILNIIFKYVENKKSNATYDKEQHHQTAREVARESMVLLKNENGILPLKKEGTIAVIGEFAINPRFQGSGSSHINPTKLENILEEIEKAAPDAKVLYAQGYELSRDKADQELIDSARLAASQSEVAVLFAGLPDRYESEGYDRTHLSIPENQIYLIEELSKVQPNLVVVLSNGAPVEMPWLENVKGLLEAYLGGQALGGAVADLLFGNVNPSGKLAETFLKELRHNPSYLNFPGEGDKVEYKEGLFVGYRYYDAKNIEPLFPFGYGLSYTNFKYTNLAVSKKEISDNEAIYLTVTVKNTGNIAGKEIIQLYVHDIKSSVIRPEKELKGFEKIDLQPGEEKAVTFVLDKRAFAYYNTDINDWHVETGEFEILIGKSSKEIVLKEKVFVTSTVAIKKKVHKNTTVGDILTDPVLAPIAKETLTKAIEGGPFGDITEDSGAFDMFEAILTYIPLRGMVSFNPKKFTEDMLDDLIVKLNNAIEDNE